MCFVQFVQDGGSIEGRHGFFRSGTLDRMLGEKADRSGDSESYGFGIGTSRGQRYWYAGGDLGGYHTVLLWFPEHDRALVTMAASGSNVATWNLVPKVMESWFGTEEKPAAASLETLPNSRKYATRVAGIYRPARDIHIMTSARHLWPPWSQSGDANADGSITYVGERWIAVEPLRFRNVADGRQLSFQEDSSGQVRFMNRESEQRIAWYQSGRTAYRILLLLCPTLRVCPLAKPSEEKRAPASFAGSSDSDSWRFVACSGTPG